MEKFQPSVDHCTVKLPYSSPRSDLEDNDLKKFAAYERRFSRP